MKSIAHQALCKCSSIFVISVCVLIGCCETSEDYLILNGRWSICTDPGKEFNPNISSDLKWSDIQVPGECQIQGFPVRHEIPFVYKKTFMVPSEFEGSELRLFFDGVYSFARVWINNTYLREHTGGFTSWDCDITPYVSPGDSSTLIVECTDKRNDPSYASGYAKHQIGGILRDVYVKALPKERIKGFKVETIFDNNYQNAKLQLDLDMILESEASLLVSLTDPDGNETSIHGSRIQLAPSENKKLLEYKILNPVKWDAEHPFLYTLKFELTRKGKTLHTMTEKIGFRTIRILGNKLLVNGKPIKLRGACRHDIHPLLGRSASSGYDLTDAVLAREANINFIRTSHYPPSKRFADICDSLGIYLEVENAVCFLRTTRLPEYDTVPHSGPVFDESINKQLNEMVQTFTNNPSVIIWSLGNESVYDDTFVHGYDYLKYTDPNRPVIFSYPGTVPKGIKCFDILSIHYPKYDGSADDKEYKISDFVSDTIPILYDEWAHVACYNKPTLQSDVNVREFWGKSLDSMWFNCLNSEGALGGAIWGFIDETFMMPYNLDGFDQWWGIKPSDSKEKYESRTIGYGEWGIIDVWRRKKPEFWSVMKAYSPVRMDTKEISEFKPGDPLRVNVRNRFNHTILSEIFTEWKYKEKSGRFACPGIPPGETGLLEIPGQQWEKGTRLNISFRDRNNRLIDKYVIRIGDIDEYSVTDVNVESSPPTISGDDSVIRVSGDFWHIDFSKQTGLITAATIKGDTILKGGPYLNYTHTGNYIAFTTMEHLSPVKWWKLVDLKARTEGNMAVIRITGNCGDSFNVNYTLTITRDGYFKTRYMFDNPVDKPIIELGINYYLPESFDTLKWIRNSYWSAYPDGHMGRPEGETPIRELSPERYRTCPHKDWEKDICNFYYRGVENSLYAYRLPNEVTALKENVFIFNLIKSSSGNSLSVISDGSLSCRLLQDSRDHITLITNNLWDYPDLLWGNYMRMLKVPDKADYEIMMQLCQNQ